VIDRAAFDRISGYIEYAREHDAAEIIAGGRLCDCSAGYFIDPTVILTTDPHFKTMEEEIFGPVLTIYVYADEDFEATLDLCDQNLALRPHRRHLRPGPDERWPRPGAGW
jgi:1-pyrroline-5-carboxylate dehydrogenase